MLSLVARTLRRIQALYHSLSGRLAWRCRRTSNARHHFERVLILGGSAFSAYLYLARIALSEGDYAGYRREMGNARACDPDRFTRLRLPTEGLEPRTAGTPFEETMQRATWRSARYGNNQTRRPTVRSAELPTDFNPDNAFGADNAQPSIGSPLDELIQFVDSDHLELQEDRQTDDFNSWTERERFRHLPPIDEDAIRQVDIDEITRRF